MAAWKLKWLCKKPNLNSPVLIEGLPGIGNVGKVAADFMIEMLKAKKLAEFHSNAFPHSVFVNENNLVELPKIELYYKQFKNKKKDFLFIAGDIQPIDEESCYTFCDLVLDLLEQFNGKEFITLGGIGLKAVPKKPKIYCTGTNRRDVHAFVKGMEINEELYGIVGPIIGVSGVLVGLGGRRKLSGVTLLAETFGHPMYLGVSGAREIVKTLNKKFGFGISLKDLDKEISVLEGEITKRTKDIAEVQRRTIAKGRLGKGEVNYIG